jgi:hypothetical protein
MKLSSIVESGLKGKTIIRNTAEAIGDLISYIYQHGQPAQKKALDAFLKEPTPHGWDQSKWLIKAAIQQASTDRNLTDNIKAWSQLASLTSPVVTAAVYDIDQKQAKGTPLQNLVLSRGMRDKYKQALGPQGYVGTMANVGDVGPNKLRNMLKTTAKNSTAIAKATKKDMPNIRPVTKF